MHFQPFLLQSQNLVADIAVILLLTQLIKKATKTTTNRSYTSSYSVAPQLVIQHINLTGLNFAAIKTVHTLLWLENVHYKFLVYKFNYLTHDAISISRFAANARE